MDPVEPELVRTMPLHAITEVHGEAGLRLRLEREAGRLPERDREMLAAA
jgi:hypothetical protein